MTKSEDCQDKVCIVSNCASAALSPVVVWLLCGFCFVFTELRILGAPFAPRKYAKGTRSAGRLAFIFYKQAAPWIPRSLLGISDFKSLGLGGEVGKTDKLYSCQWVHC